MSQTTKTYPSSVPAPRRSLYDITSDILRFHELREQAEYEGDSEAVALIDAQLKQFLQQELPAKVDGIRNYIRWQENEAQVRQEEAKEQAILAGRAQDNIERMKEVLLWCMQQLGKTKLEGALHWIRRQGNGGLKPLIIRQPELVPLGLLKTTVTLDTHLWRSIVRELLEGEDRCVYRVDTVPNNEAIRAALERGEGVPGCELGERGEHVRVS
jgi:hypothetical protein